MLCLLHILQTTTPSMAAQQLHAEGLSLYQACASGTLSAVKQMLQLQPKCTLQWLEQNEYPLHVAAEHNHHLVVKEMLQYFIATCTGDPALPGILQGTPAAVNTAARILYSHQSITSDVLRS